MSLGTFGWYVFLMNLKALSVTAITYSNTKIILTAVQMPLFFNISFYFSALAKAHISFKITGSNTTLITLYIGSKWEVTMNLHKFRIVILCELNYIAQLQEMPPKIPFSSELG